MMNAFALFPILSMAPLYLALKGRHKISVLTALAFFLASLGIGLSGASWTHGLLCSVLFLAIGYFPLHLRQGVRNFRKTQRENLKVLADKISESKLVCDQWSENRVRLLKEMDQIANRYALAKGLVSYVDERPVLQELGSIFSTKKFVVGISFFRNAMVSDTPILEDLVKGEGESKSWSMYYSTGWISEAQWRKIFREVRPVLDQIQDTFVIEPLSNQFYRSLEQFGSFYKHRGKTHENTVILVAIPVKWDGKVRGLLNLLMADSIPQDFLEEISVYAQLLGLGLHKISLYQLMVERSRRDGLTNLYLRRVLIERLNEEIGFTKRYGSSFSLLLFDLDNFKRINDRYGHIAGDKVLRKVAECLRTTLHSGITIARYGGEEFAVLIGLTPQEIVMKIAEELRVAISNLDVYISSEIRLNITVSIGVAHYLPDAPAANELLERADIALYRAKSRGKNCVIEWRKSER